MKSTASRVYQEFISSLLQADSFRNNWYSYATNQLSHTLLGFLTSCLVSYVSFLILDEFWVKEYILITSAAIYLLVELIQKQDNIWDCIEDFTFFVVYGAGSGYLLFDEVSVGSPEVRTNILYTLNVVSIISAHLSIGILIRILQTRGNK